MNPYSEDQLIEQPAINLLKEIGWETLNCYGEFEQTEKSPLGRQTKSEAVLTARLQTALKRFNPTATDAAIAKAIEELTHSRAVMSPIEANREIYTLLKDGVRVTLTDPDSEDETVEVLRVIDWEHPEHNDFFAASQFWITGEMYTKRPDIVCFVNGIPYIFTLIHKFQTQGSERHPVLSERSDIVVITDEAHRSQYDTLALNMRIALPNAAFIAFTGTPLMAGEEKTKGVFGDYVSIYDFNQSIVDRATVPLYYENRVPTLQLINEDFNADIEQILSEEELAVFDLLTQREPHLTDPERDEVKNAVKEMLETLKREKLGLDWRKHTQTRAQVKLAVENILDDELPSPYTLELFNQRSEAVYQHIYDSYYGEGESVYTEN